jgi:hypothetical protein
MARKRQVFQKDETGYGDFIYIDLLPDVRRSRQFNVNVITILLFGVILMFFLIYRPYSEAVFEYERLNSINNDLRHELLLTQEEFRGYEIDLDVIAFAEDIDDISSLKVNFNNLFDDIELIVDSYSGDIALVSYDTELETLEIDILSVSQFAYSNINNQILNLDWVNNSRFTTPEPLSNNVEYKATFIIEVNYDVE